MAAEKWCKENGVSYGSMCKDEPRGLMYGNYLIAKWKNLTPAEKKACHGLMTSDNFRNGKVTITIMERR